MIDTAGIRNTENEIEKIGVEKAKEIANQADLIIAIFDITKKLSKEDLEILKIIEKKNAIIVLNKTDLIQENKDLEEKLSNVGKTIVK